PRDVTPVVQPSSRLPGRPRLDLPLTPPAYVRLPLPLQLGVGDDPLEGAGAGPRLEHADPQDRGRLLALQLVAVEVQGEFRLQAGIVGHRGPRQVYKNSVSRSSRPPEERGLQDASASVRPACAHAAR